MRTVLNKQPLRRDFGNHPEVEGLILESDIQINRGRLRLKLLVFYKPVQLRAFWKNVLGKDSLGKGCLGAVNSLQVMCENPATGARRKEVDGGYFAIMGLCAEHLGMEILSHEAVHAGFAYAQRVGNHSPWHDAFDLDEEHLAYPTGRVACEVLRTLRRYKLVP